MIEGRRRQAPRGGDRSVPAVSGTTLIMKAITVCRQVQSAISKATGITATAARVPTKTIEATLAGS